MTGRPGSNPPWDQRPFGTWGAIEGDRGVWLREVQPFIEGEALSPFVRVVLAADNANGTLNAGPRGLPYINADLTLTLAALPQGEWIGMNPVSRSAIDGVSVGTVDVYDRTRRIGQVAMIGLADLRNFVTE